MDAYTIAYHNAHLDPMNPDKWEALREAASDLETDASQPADLRQRMAVSAIVARQCKCWAESGVSPLSDEAQADIARRINRN